MRHFKIFAAAGFIILYLLVSSNSYANDNGGREEKRQKIWDQLNLTQDQKKQLEANKQQHRAKSTAVRRQMKINRDLLRAELMKPQLDSPKINAIEGQIKNLMSQMEDNKLESILAVRSILTAEQFAKFINLMHRKKNTST